MSPGDGVRLQPPALSGGCKIDETVFGTPEAGQRLARFIWLKGLGDDSYHDKEVAMFRLLLLIEIVDKEDKINAFIPELDKMMGDGLVTLEKVRIIRYRGTAPS